MWLSISLALCLFGILLNKLSLRCCLCPGILPLDYPFSGLCDVIDVDEHLLGNPRTKPLHVHIAMVFYLKVKYVSKCFTMFYEMHCLLCMSVCFPVHKPEKLSWICAAGAIRDGVCAYTALHTHARMAAGHTLLVMDGASV